MDAWAGSVTEIHTTIGVKSSLSMRSFPGNNPHRGGEVAREAVGFTWEAPNETVVV